MLKKYKQLITGFILGACAFSIFPVKAAVEQYILYKADYKVEINGKEYTDPDNPILTREGVTYAPLRSMLSAAGLDIGWNADTGVATVNTNHVTGPTPTPISSPIATTTPDIFPKKEKPADIETIEYNNDYYVTLKSIELKFPDFRFDYNYQKNTVSLYFVDKITGDETSVYENVGYLSINGEPCFRYFDYEHGTKVAIEKRG